MERPSSSVHERLAVMETEVSYIKTTVAKIDTAVSELNTWKIKVIAGSSVISAIVTFLAMLFTNSQH